MPRSSHTFCQRASASRALYRSVVMKFDVFARSKRPD
jgi:hypothetical protein